MSLSKFSCPLDIQSDTKCFTTLLLQLYFPCKCEEETKRCIVKSWLRPHSWGRPSHITLNTHRYLWKKRDCRCGGVVHKSTTSNCFLLLALLILPSFWFPSEGALYKEVAFFFLGKGQSDIEVEGAAGVHCGLAFFSLNFTSCSSCCSNSCFSFLRSTEAQ